MQYALAAVYIVPIKQMGEWMFKFVVVNDDEDDDNCMAQVLTIVARARSYSRTF